MNYFTKPFDDKSSFYPEMKMKIKNALQILFFPALVPILSAAEIDIPVHYDTLENGLKVIMVPDTNVAVVSSRLYYFVGSMYEGPGTSGLSHMYEHMMFKGTKRLGTKDYEKEKVYIEKIDSIDAEIQELRREGSSEADSQIQTMRAEIFSILEEQRKYISKDEIWELYQSNGGTHLNAWTADDMTAYIVTLPQNKLELFYWIESDRMANPVLREFYSERDVVTEERRMRYENRPVNKYFERLFSLFYIAHPYRIPTIGWMSDIRAYTRGKLYDHVNRYYTPDNALIVLAGNINPEQEMKNIRRYFGSIPRAETPKQEVVTREPAPMGQTRFIVHENARPRIDVMFHTPGYPHNDLYPLDVAEGVLSGKSGRLYDRLVNKEELATSAGASNAYRLHDGYFHVYADLKEGVDPDTVEAILKEELANLIKEGPRQSEMDRIKNSIRKSFASKLKSLEGLSDQLAWFERLGNWEDMPAYPEKIADVQPAQVSEAVERYLIPDKATIGILTTPSKQASAEGDINQ